MRCRSGEVDVQAGEETLGAELPAFRKPMEVPANRAGVPVCVPGGGRWILQ